LGCVIVAVKDPRAVAEQRREKERKRRAAKLQSYKRLIRLHNLLLHTPVVRTSYNSLFTQIQNLSIYSAEDSKVVTVRSYLKSLAISAVFAVIIILLFQDLIITALALYLASTVRTTLINGHLNKEQGRLLHALQHTLTSIREEHALTGSIVDAVANCERDACLDNAIAAIHGILTSDNSTEELEKFNESCPMQVLSTVAGICYIYNEVGEGENHFAFRDALNMASEEVDLEIRNRTYLESKMSFRRVLPLVMPLVLGPLQMYLTSIMPGTASVYNSTVGYISMALAIGLCGYGYAYNTKLTAPVSVVSDDRVHILNKIQKSGVLRRLVKTLLPKKVKALKAYNRLIKVSQSTQDLEYIYTTKIVLALSVFFVTIVTLAIVTVSAKVYLYNSVTSTSLSSVSSFTEEENVKLLEIDKEYLAAYPGMWETELTERLEKEFPRKTALVIADEVSRIMKKGDTYYNIYFKWWYILVAFFLSIFAWYMPDMELRSRAKRIASVVEEDVLQMQTILGVLKDTPLDVLEVLYWLERQTRIHKSIMTRAIHEYPNDPEKALRRLRESSGSFEFARMCQRLSTASQALSLAEAFADIKTERVQVMKLRELMSKDIADKKIAKATVWMYVAFGAVLVAGMFVPIGVLAINEWGTLQQSLTF